VSGLHDPPNALVATIRAKRQGARGTMCLSGTPRLKIIPNAFGERAVLKLMFGALIRAAERWRSIKVTEFEHRQITAVRKELDQEYEAQVGLKTQLSKDAAPVKISSNLRI